jgi:hypothetical protein
MKSSIEKLVSQGTNTSWQRSAIKRTPGFSRKFAPEIIFLFPGINPEAARYAFVESGKKIKTYEK